MQHYNYLKNQRAIADWICRDANFNMFITLTLKQGLLCDTYRGRIIPIQRDDCVRTAWLFRDRLAQKVLGSGRRRRGEKLPFAAFVEGDQVIRTHLHIVTVRPAEMHLAAFSAAAIAAGKNLIWLHKRMDIRPISNGSPESVVNYCLKEGTDAFLADAFCPYA